MTVEYVNKRGKDLVLHVFPEAVCVPRDGRFQILNKDDRYAKAIGSGTTADGAWLMAARLLPDSVANTPHNKVSFCKGRVDKSGLL